MILWHADAHTGVTLTFFAPEVTLEVMAVLTALTDAMTRRELQEKLGLKDAEHFRKHYLTPTLNNGFIEMTIHDRPKSRFQRYRLTQLGRYVLARPEEGA